jgi:hypothetical protein
MTHQTLKKLFVFFVGVLFMIFPGIFVSAQADGSAPPLGDTGVADAVAPVPVETTTAPTEAAPRVAPATSTSATAPVSVPTPSPLPQGTTPSPTPRPVSPVLPDEKTAASQMPVPPSPLSMPENPNSFPYALVALAAALVLVIYGMTRALSQKKTDKKEEEPNNKCDQIKELLERKKSTLEIVSGTISLKQALIDFLTKKIEAKKEEMKDEVVTVVAGEVLGEEGEKIFRSVKEASETYETLVENLEQAKKALEYFTNRRKQLTEDVGKIESAYQTCLLGNSVFEGTSGLSRGLEIFEAELHQKLYRYISDGKDVFSPGAVLAANLAEMVEAGKWLPSPELPEGILPTSLRFFLTEKGKAEYEKSLLPLHKKYLSDISCKEADFSEIRGIVYEDERQVVAQNKD